MSFTYTKFLSPNTEATSNLFKLDWLVNAADEEIVTMLVRYQSDYGGALLNEAKRKAEYRVALEGIKAALSEYDIAISEKRVTKIKDSKVLSLIKDELYKKTSSNYHVSPKEIYGEFQVRDTKHSYRIKIVNTPIEHILRQINEVKKIFIAERHRSQMVDPKYLAALQYAAEHHYNISEYISMGSDAVINEVNNMAKDEYCREHYPIGEVVAQSVCSECCTWVVGENRCECGNRRMHLYVSGDIINGIDVYPEAH